MGPGYDQDKPIFSMHTRTRTCTHTHHRRTCYLSELPGDTDGPAEAVAADEQGLHSPASKVAKSKDVEVAQDALPCDHCTVHSIFLQGETD